jgi:glycosyltransferase involved in cell wall biosynthesis
MGEGTLKRILFLTHRNPQGYRIQQYFPYLEKKGFEVELLTTETSFLQLLDRARASDVVYIQRLLVNPLKLPVLRSFAKRLVYDFDDAVMYGAKGESDTRRRKFRKMVMASDAVLCGNMFLLSEAKRYGGSASYYVPTVVDTDEYPVKSHNDSLKPVAGWIGSASTLPYLAGLEGVMEALAGVGACSFEVVADKAPDMEIPGMTFRKWEKKGEKDLLLGFDVGMMPLKDDPWSRGKCGLKLIQYMASGLPSVAHPVGVAPEMIVDGVDGFLPDDAEGWKDALTRLATDPVLRRRMGKAAREKAEERYSVATWGPKVAEIIDSL